MRPQFMFPTPDSGIIHSPPHSHFHFALHFPNALSSPRHIHSFPLVLFFNASISIISLTFMILVGRNIAFTCIQVPGSFSRSFISHLFVRVSFVVPSLRLLEFALYI